MKRMFLLIIPIFIGLTGTLAINAQTNLKGRYIFEGKDEGVSFNYMLTFEGKDAVYYSYEHNGAATLKGSWKDENGVITVDIPNGDLQLMFKFKLEGKDLVVTETLHHSFVDAGAIFRKMDDTPSGAELTPEEIGKRATKLIKSIKSQNDLSAENLEKQIGMKVFFSKKNPKEFGVGGNVAGAPDWTYGFHGIPHTIEGVEKIGRLDFAFNYQLYEPLNPDMTTVCKAFDVDSLSKELQADGFSAPQPHYRVHNRLSGWDFTRGKVSVRVSVKGGWEPDIDKCVDLILISLVR